MPRTLLAAAVLAVLPVTAAADPPKPAAVAQTAPAGRILADVRAVIRAAGGPQGPGAVEDFDKSLKRVLGEKGFEGLDLNRPLAAYTALPEDGAKTAPVLVLPVTGKKEFLDLLDRIGLKTQEEPGNKGLYRVAWFLPALLRFHDGLAYVGLNGDAAALNPKALVPAAELVRADETALLAVRVDAAKLPVKVLTAPLDLVLNARKAIGGGAGGPQPVVALGFAELTGVFPLAALARNNLDRVVTDGKELAVRLRLDPATGDVGVEATVVPKPGTGLAKSIAALTPKANRFAGLVGKDTVGGGAAQLPLHVPEVRDLVVRLIDAAGEGMKKDALETFQPAIKKAFDGLRRRAKGDSLEFAAALNGPDAGGNFTAVFGVSFDDPADMDEAFRDTVKALPDTLRKIVKLDAEKTDALTIHTAAVGALLAEAPNAAPEVAKLFGREAVFAVGFGKDSIVAAYGKDAVAAVKGAGKLPAVPGRVFDTVLNPARVGKAMAATGNAQEAAMFARMFPEDRPLTGWAIDARGGADFTLTARTNVSSVARMFLVSRVSAFPAGGPVAAPPK